MKILIDLRACHYYQERGISNYALSIARELNKLAELDCYFLIHKHRPEIKLLHYIGSSKTILLYEDIDGCEAEFDAFFMTSVLHGLNLATDFEHYAVPPVIARQKPLLLAIHYDLIPLVFQDRYLTNPDVAKKYLLSVHILKKFDHLFSISDFSTDDAVRFLGIPRRRISTLPPAFDATLWAADRRVGKTADLIYTGGDDFRKNLTRLVEGFATYKVRGGTLRLVIVCRMNAESETNYLKQAAALGCEADHIEFAGLLPADELVRRVASARAAIFPSIYEGLGLPILEAYAVETPVIGASTTSTGPLLEPGCRFDPYCADAIASAIERIESDAALRDRSIAFGSTILAECGWDKGARTIAAIAGQLHRAKPTRSHEPRDARLAIVGCLAPERSGIAYYNTKSYLDSKNDTLFFTGIDTYEMAQQKRHLLQQSSRLNIVNGKHFHDTMRSGEIQTAVFIIGNSEHNILSLQAAIDSRYSAMNRIVYLHEARVTGLMYCFFGYDGTKARERLAECYPELRIDPGLWQAEGNSLFGLRLLVSMTGISKFIVNSHRAARLVHDDLGPVKHDVEVLFLPILDLEEKAPSTSPVVEKSGTFKLAHFGIVGPPKRPKMLIEAASVVARKMPVSLSFVGYGCNESLRAELKAPDFVSFVDSPTDQELIELMRSVDVALQPREPDHGESSGVLMQLLSVGKRPITSEGTAADDLRDFVTLIPRLSDAAVWARAIEDTLLHGTAVGDLEHLSTRAFASRFDAAVRSLCGDDRSAADFAGSRLRRGSERRETAVRHQQFLHDSRSALLREVPKGAKPS